MSIFTPDRCKLTRQVSFSTTGVTVTDVSLDTIPFMGELISSEGNSEVEADRSAREIRPARLRWSGGFYTPPNVPSFPGDRVTIAMISYEVLGLPERLKYGRRTIGWEVPILPVSTLYPITADLLEMDETDTIVQESIPVCVYNPSDQRGGTGSYENLVFEAGPEFWDELKVENRILRLAGRKYKIFTAVMPVHVPVVRMEARSAR